MKTLLLALVGVSLARADVRTERVPEQGMQPQIAQGTDGTLHLVYLKGTPNAADVRYATKPPGAKAWSAPITVNSQPGSAIAVGTIRGAQLAVGKDNTIHVVWNGPGRKGVPAPLYYSRRTTTFEPQRDVRGDSVALDGGASIAASAKGDVFIVWHGARPDSTPGEHHRVVFVLKSIDNGRTFTAPTIANRNDEGVCACCSLKAFVAPDGRLLTLYRAARQLDQREITLLSSSDGGSTFQHRVLAPWAISACPMSSMTMIAASNGVRGAWETEGKICTALLDESAAPISVSGDKSRHPSLAVNAKGETLVSWSIGTGWQRGGDVGWQVLDAQGHATGAPGSIKGVPVWGFTAAYAETGGFVVMY